MEIIIDCPKCGASEIETKEDWALVHDIQAFMGRCNACQAICRAELVPHGASIKLFVDEIDTT